MDWRAVAAIAYGAAMLMGGVMGYRRAGSKPSLLGGLIIGGLALVGGLIMLGGTESGRSMALLGAMMAVLLFGWTLSRGILSHGKGTARAGGLLALSMLTVWIMLWT